MKKGSLLRRSGVSFRSAAEESLIEDRSLIILSYTEYSEDKSEDDENSEWEIERNEPVRITASGGENVPSGTDREISPRTVGGKRRKGDAGPSKSEKSTPGPSEKSTPGPSEPTKCKKRAEKDRVEMENARQSRKHRIVEYSADESKDDEDSEWEIERNEPVRITASGGENVPSGTDREISPRTVGGKRRKGETATRKSTRQRRGVDKMGGVLIHRIEHK